jgi:hypothetical protein
LIWVDVIPSTGTSVGCAGIGVSLSEGAGVWVAVAVKGTEKGVGVTIVSSLNLELQPVYKRIKTVKITLENRMGTLGFYRLSQ